MKSSKPNFEKLMEDARLDDTIVIGKLDRLGRSTVKLIELMELLKNKGINLKSLSESIDTGTAIGNLFFQFMCVLAEHERNVRVHQKVWDNLSIGLNIKISILSNWVGFKEINVSLLG